MQMRNARDQPSTGLDVFWPMAGSKAQHAEQTSPTKRPIHAAYAHQVSMVRVIRSLVMGYETRREDTP